jgi:hypothetical protein
MHIYQIELPEMAFSTLRKVPAERDRRNTYEIDN